MPVESATNAAGPPPRPRTGAVAWALRSQVARTEHDREQAHEDLARGIELVARAGRAIRNADAALDELRAALALEETPGA